MTRIRILEADRNKRGDLFGRLVTDLFFALGYDEPRLNIHKAGREIDVEATHRWERRRLVAECKAEVKKTGGDAINKFIGSLDAEKRKDTEKDTVGYFVSLSGFTETAIEQEKDFRGERLVTLDGDDVVRELVEGHIIVPLEKAMERAGRCAATESPKLSPETEIDLLAHEKGWIWAIYFARNKERTHFALIHADGQGLAPTLAETVVAADEAVKGSLHSLTYLPPRDEPPIADSAIAQARERYCAYLAAECGDIQLEGLPADEQVGSRRLQLEKLFVPLRLVRADEARGGGAPSAAAEEGETPEEPEPVGKVLSEAPRLAVLAQPGGGKSTLLKRLATAYALPERRDATDDGLPDRVWLPIFIRCRQVESPATASIRDIIGALPERAEMPELADAFGALVDRALRSGDAMFLIDGLDEISDEASRISFVNQLRVFLATYPAAAVVVTSREAGFRVVGGALSAYCSHYRIADFDDQDIKRLTLAWHKEVVGDTPDVRSEAERLAQTIVESDRVRRLARNPLLLTTLLLVKRWVGQLPTRRSVLYGKAIEVLLMTWNVQGYEPLDQDEVLPQLEFVAFTMMKEGVQTITSRRLREILTQARAEMPEVLGYARLSVSDFIERVELRSSLLVQSGHEVEQGTLYPTYEFRHLTFQEYLTARAVVDGHYPGRRDDDTILSVLEPHLGEERCREVVPLAAVLAGRAGQPLVQRLVEECRASREGTDADEGRAPSELPWPAGLLASCLLDEVQAPPALIEHGLEETARAAQPADVIARLYRGRYGTVLGEVVRRVYPTSLTELLNLGGSLGWITLVDIGWEPGQNVTASLKKTIARLFVSEDPVQRSAAAVAVMEIAYSFSPKSAYHDIQPSGSAARAREVLGGLADNLVGLLQSEQVHQHFAAAWAFAWLGELDAWSPADNPAVLSRMVQLLSTSPSPEVKYVAAWGLCALPLIGRDSAGLAPPARTLLEWLHDPHPPPGLRGRDWAFTRASLVAAFYLRAPWTDTELAELLRREVSTASTHPVHEQFIERGSAMLRALGKAGRRALQAVEKEGRRPEGQGPRRRRSRPG